LKVSIVIPTRNEGEFLLYTVKWILANNERAGLEVIVVDDGSTDESIAQLIDQYGESSPVNVIPGPQLGPGNARNYGGLHASGDVIVFIDAHCYTPPDWLEGMVNPLNDPTIGLVGCAFADLRYPETPACLGVGCTWRQASLELEWLPYQQPDMHSVPLLPGGCQAMRRSDFLSFGQYDSGMSHIGIEGEEQSLRCWLMGTTNFVNNHPTRSDLLS